MNFTWASRHIYTQLSKAVFRHIITYKETNSDFN